MRMVTFRRDNMNTKTSLLFNCPLIAIHHDKRVVIHTISTIPVSYTHLDVYKRQKLYRRDNDSLKKTALKYAKENRKRYQG